MNETPVNEPLVDTAEADARNKKERTLSDRILGYAFLGSIVLNIGWVALVSHSDLFGKGSILPLLHEKPIKVFKPIPVKPKPKPVKPPPPPPKPPKTPPKIPPIHQHPHPTPPRPTPTRTINVAHSNNSHAAPAPSMPSSPPSNDQAPPNPGVQSPPSPPVPPSPPAPPAPPSPPATPPAPPAPPPSPPPSPPPPVVHPRNYSPIPSQDVGVVGDFADVQPPDDVHYDQLTSTSVTVEWTVDENGHPTDVHVTQSCGDSSLDDACMEAIRHTTFKPAIQDHIKLRQQMSRKFPVSQG